MKAPNAQRQLERHLAAICAPPAKRTARSPNPRATSPRASRPATSSKRPIELPFLAHATMEPLNATVHLKPDSCEIWTGTQIMSAGAVGGGEGGRTAGRESDRQQSPARRRLRPQARARHGGRGRAHRQAGRWTGEGGVDPRRRHPARHLSSGLSRHDCRDPVRRQDRRLEISSHRLGHPGALAAARVPERHRHRRRR